ncbi:MAG: sugar phosphate isomerase/epimerase [Victivallales bacterium]|nr:sugar phosphate isomerase/epimerase [Victivallales bacterium]
MRIASTTGDFLDYVANDDIPQAVRLLAQCGFRHIDVNLGGALFKDSRLCSDGWETWAEEIKRTGIEMGVDFVQAHASDSAYAPGQDRDYRMEMLRREMQVCKVLGIPGMVVHAISRPQGDREDFLKANTAMYSELLKSAEETGVRVYTENTCTANCPTYFLYEGSDFNELRERLGRHPLFGCCWDVGHANVQDVDQYKCITEMGDGLMAVHIHDNDGRRDLHLQPYSGNTCYDAILSALCAIGFKGCFTLEALSLPVAQTFCFCRRKRFTQQGKEHDKLGMLPLEFKMRSQRYMFDVVRFMLETYGCFEE